MTKKTLTISSFFITIALLFITKGNQSEVYAQYTVGQSYWGRNNYIQYIPGNLPIIISAPHSGTLKPSEIPNRTSGSVLSGLDSGSRQYTLAAVDQIENITGKRPHLIINHIHRSKLDANRNIGEAANGNKWAEQAWREFHYFIDLAAETVTDDYGSGHYFDMHTIYKAHGTVEMGYLLRISDVNGSNAQLNAAQNRSSMRNFNSVTGISFAEAIRGELSFGSLLSSEGYLSFPSAQLANLSPLPYMNGGYNTSRHGSRSGGQINGTQMEPTWQFTNTANRVPYGRAVGRAILCFVQIHYGFNLGYNLSNCNVDTSLIPPTGPTSTQPPPTEPTSTETPPTEPVATPTPTPEPSNVKAGYIHPGIDIAPSSKERNTNYVYSTHAGFVTYAGPAPAEIAEKGWVIQIESDMNRDNVPDIITRYNHLLEDTLLLNDFKYKRINYTPECFLDLSTCLNGTAGPIEKLPYGYGPYVARNQVLGRMGDSGSPGHQHVQYEIVTNRYIDTYSVGLDSYSCQDNPYIEACTTDSSRPGFFFPINRQLNSTVRGPVYINPGFTTPIPALTPITFD